MVTDGISTQAISQIATQFGTPAQRRPTPCSLSMPHFSKRSKDRLKTST